MTPRGRDGDRADRIALLHEAGDGRGDGGVAGGEGRKFARVATTFGVLLSPTGMVSVAGEPATPPMTSVPTVGALEVSVTVSGAGGAEAHELLAHPVPHGDADQRLEGDVTCPEMVRVAGGPSSATAGATTVIANVVSR
jgi:hypothetical protein